MKTIRDCSVHPAVVAVLDGDHALVENVKTLSRKVIKSPNTNSKLENQLRLTVLASKRKWIADKLTAFTGMSIVSMTPTEIGALKTPFEKFDIATFAKSYAKAHSKKTGFSLKGIKKTRKDVENVYQMVLALENSMFPMMNKTLVMDDKVMDGTHRLVAYYWASQLRRKKLPDLKCFHWSDL